MSTTWQEKYSRRQEVKLLLTLAFTPSLCPNLCDYGYKFGVAEQWDEFGQALEAGGEMSLSC
ncbi:MAG: hypothetical protein V7K89_13500 [Nostoc sp.]|uniref:hypothetical protein n=1 Tax=Nostoc sp. TaxID=1180 RepID=UPI002FFCB903